ncbi:TPA: hypothetical protein ACUL0F_002717 [Staphylococcus aureus]
MPTTFGGEPKSMLFTIAYMLEIIICNDN